MKAVIMAAGRGTRISRHIQGKPKCCVEFNGEPIIRRTLRVLKSHGIRDVALITGYQSGEVIKAMQPYQPAVFYNPFFDVTNSIASLWFAKEFFNEPDDTIIINGDLFIEDGLLQAILSEPRSPVFLADSSRIAEADYRFVWKDDVLQRYGKDIPDEDTTGEYVGIGKFDKSFFIKFITKLDEMISSQQSGKWWEDIFYAFVGTGTRIYVKDIAGVFWAELDYVEDYNRVLAHLGIKPETAA
ncbi:MAG: NTP transferase domain-containing protein [Rhodoferax sp.]